MHEFLEYTFLNKSRQRKKERKKKDIAKPTKTPKAAKSTKSRY